METKHFTFTARIPDRDEFGGKYTAYKNHATSGGSRLFDLIMVPEPLFAAIVATDMGFPAVAGIEKKVSEEVNTLSDFDKQYVGALVCAMMEENGFRKTGEKKPTPLGIFTVGEFYARK